MPVMTSQKKKVNIDDVIMKLEMSLPDKISLESIKRQRTTASDSKVAGKELDGCCFVTSTWNAV